MASAPTFTGTPRISPKLVSAANTNRDGTGTIVDIWTAPAAGSRIEHVDVQARVTTTAGMVRLYIHDGTAYFLIKEIPVSAITVSASVAGFFYSFNCAALSSLLVMQSTYKLAASTHNAEAFVVTAVGGDY